MIWLKIPVKSSTYSLKLLVLYSEGTVEGNSYFTFFFLMQTEVPTALLSPKNKMFLSKLPTQLQTRPSTDLLASELARNDFCN